MISLEQTTNNQNVVLDRKTFFSTVQTLMNSI